MRTKETGRKAIGFEYPHGSDEWLKSRVLKLCKHGSVRGAGSFGRSTATLDCHSGFRPREGADRAALEAADFVHNLQDAVKEQLYLVLNAPILRSLRLNSRSSVCSFHQRRNLRKLVSLWFYALDESPKIVKMLYKNTNCLLEQAPTSCESFI